MKLPFLCLCAMCAACGVGAEFDLGRDGVDLKVVATPDAVDPARDFFVTVTLTAEADVALPDLRDRFRGFQVAEDFDEEPVKGADGRVTTASRWRLVPEPRAKKYSLRPFVVKNFYTAPVVFAPPADRENVTGAMEVDPHKDLPPFSWKLAAWGVLALAAAVVVIWALWRLAAKVREMMRVHKMNPLQRAYWELERLLSKGLPGRGRYKDYYVELTMVVRRYVQRRYGVRAPNLTTEEFFAELAHAADLPPDGAARLKPFLESADLVKFAGVEASPEMADAAAHSAREYLASDAAQAPFPKGAAPSSSKG